MRITVLCEDTCVRDGFCAEHGLSLYVETNTHRILFDMGQSEVFAQNARALGIDLSAVDVAVLSHGHYDHGGGLSTFLARNQRADVYVSKHAFGDYYSNRPEEGLEYIGLDQSLDLYRFTLTGDETVIDDERMLFGDVPDPTGALAASANLCQKTWDGVHQDQFYHEQNLIIREGDKAVLVAGCAHRGIVNIVAKAEKILGRRPDVVISGFHLFRLTAGDPAADGLIRSTADAMLAGDTVYYTGHCTGDYAFEKLKEILGERLQRISGGESFTI
jgi:7,8-dihydropterin-6-yl-methyl-4-(beta-D-ribofuranosyl)aminobenzene 5'-phosphate synthase